MPYLKGIKESNLKKNILIIGAGGHSKVVYDLIKSTDEYNDIEF